MLIDDYRTETCLPTVPDTVNKVMSVETQFRINHDNESYPPLQSSAVYAMSEGGYEPTTSTPKKYTETAFETIKPLNFTPEIKRESDRPTNSCHTPPRERKDSDATEEAELSHAPGLNVNTDHPKQHSPSYSDCYTSDSSPAGTPLKWEPTSPQTPVTPGSSFYNQLYPFGLHSPDRERELAFIPRKDQNGVELYFCHLCSFTGTTREIFAAHMSTHFEHSCPHCDYTSRTEGRLKRHIKDFHSTTPPDSYSGNKSPKIMPGRPKVYRCKQCEFVATEKLDFWSHARSHIKEDKLLQCPKCPFVTEYKHHLEYHLRNHFGSKPFKCNKCNYACVNKSMLNSHMKSHTNVYQYRCADCTYATKYCHSLKLHLRKYNHKPATVLNADGSLPQGLDAEAAGLSLMMKRGPPRGPRGPRKDKLEAYLGQLMSMPHLGPRPGMNGLVSPYWPLLGQFPNGFHAPPPLIPMPHGNGMLGCLPHARHPGSGGFPSQQTLTLKCTFCCFSTESRDELTNHMLKVHASDNQDLFNAFGISSDSLMEEQSQREQIKQYRQSIEDTPEDFSRKSPSSLARPPSHQAVSTTESLHIRTDTEDLTKSSPRSWPPTSAEIMDKETMNGSKSMPDLSYLSDRKSCDTSPNPEAKEDSSDILRQMTLKFGGSAQSTQRETKESPLDLTKPKMMMAANYFAAVKRSYSQMESSEMLLESRGQIETSSYSDAPSPSPRKRSRKGKAYKLDTLSWKLQGLSSEPNPSAQDDVNSIGSHDDLDDNSDSHYSEKEVEFRDLTPRNRGDLNMSEERDDSKEERRLSEASLSTPERERADSFEMKRQSFEGRDLEHIHNNLKLLNESDVERKREVSGEDRCPSPVSDMRRCSMGSNMGMPDMPRYANGEQHTPADIQEQLALKAAYTLKNTGTHAAVRKGAEIAWKILHPDHGHTPAIDPYQNGLPVQNNEPREIPIAKMFRHHNAFPAVHADMHHAMKLQGKINGLNGSLYAGSNGKKVPRGNEKFECTYCEIAFGDCVMYTMHMGYHGYKDPYKCNMCGHQSHDKVDFFLHIARAAHA